MEQIHATRLSELYHLMNDFPEKYSFDMGHWITSSRENPTPEEAECETVCCAAGWGVVLCPSWKSELEFVEGNITHRTGDDPRRNNWGNSLTLIEFLSLTEEEEASLFYSDAYCPETYGPVVPTEVAKHIEAVLQSNGYDIDGGELE